MTEQDIEREIQARVAFKMNELLTGVKNRFGHKYGQAFDMTHESQYRWEAFKEVAEMVEKEIQMGTPSQNMDRDKKWAAKEKAVDTLVETLDLRGRRDYDYKVRRIVSIIEDAQNY